MPNWKRIKGAERCRVSDEGVVIGVFGRPLRPTPDAQGYLSVPLYPEEGKPFRRRVHRLVAEAFFGPCPEGLQVNHIDGDKTNNRISNLEYVTALENTRHSIAIGHAPVGERNGMSRLTSADVREIRDLYSTGLTLQEVGLRKGISFQHVSDIVNLKAWKSVA